MKNRMIMFTMLMLLTTTAFAATLSVALDGSQAFNSIQTAIEASNNGDTVLVHPGRYIENIDYIGKSITVCSLEASTNDSTYISSTIIDGNQSGSCVAFRNSEQNATLRGFTITNGTGYTVYDEVHMGGGILLYLVEQINVTNCHITNNKAGSGGGVFSIKSSMTFSGLQIYNNYSGSQGGGITLVGASSHYPSIVFDPANRCSVYSNYGSNPTDIFVVDIRANLEINLDMFTVSVPTNFYLARLSNTSAFYIYSDTVNIQRAYRSEVNHDLYVSPSGSDSNSGLSPDMAMKSITKAIHRIAGDSLDVKTVHVLPGTYSEGEDDQILPIPLKSHVNIIGAGSDQTIVSTTMPQFNYRTNIIMSQSCTNVNLKGLRVISGVASNNRLFLGFWIKDTHISDLVANDMIVEKHGAVIIAEWETSSIDSLVLKNITTPERAVYIVDTKSGSISNSIFENIHSTYSSPDTPGDDSWGGPVCGISVSGSLTIENSVFSNIRVQNNQETFGISIWNSMTTQGADIKLSNCLFDNIRTNNTRAMLFGSNSSSNFEVTNCTFYNNYSPTAAVGTIGNVSMHNNIFYNPDANKEIVMYSTSTQQYVCNLDMDYSNIRGGSASILNASFLNTLSYGGHNLDVDPMFASTTIGESDYLRLSAGSPCVNAGTSDTSGLGLLPYDLAGNNRIWNRRIDMGCYEYGSEPYVGIDDPVAPSIPVIRVTAYPNPFSAFTNLKVDIPASGENRPQSINDVSISIYNLKGQKVKTIALDPSKVGEQFTYWDGRDAGNNQCSSGIYFINLLVNGRNVSSRKVTFIR
ncbi:MAG: FlgD immunoglobulin-like domain containing protein [Candidatus Cloacimonetes bacterium]|nr:FlgD immunoglobulin-like domain containing protein [Candidatus Cloacimonadota bacterium]